MVDSVSASAAPPLRVAPVAAVCGRRPVRGGARAAGWWLPQAGVESRLAFPGVPAGQTPAPPFGRFQPFLEFFKLVVAAVSACW